MTEHLAIATVDLTKQFDEGYLAVNQVNLQIQRGEVYGLIGPNGAGKTTLIRMLAAAEEPTTGTIHINGEPFLRGQENPEVKRQIGFLPDDFPLYEDLSVWAYLDYFGRLYHMREPHLTQRLESILDLVQLENKRDSLIGTLSRGMQQRLSLARSIIHYPALLLLDEPVSGLDPMARVQFRDIVRVLHEQGMTILISSHILSDLAEFCTSIGVMEQGRLVESSSLQDLYDRLSRQHYLVSCLGSLEDLQVALRDHPQVLNCEVLPDKQKVRVVLEGNLEEAAALLRSLIESGIAVTEFSRSQESLESIFLKLGHQQTS